MHKLIALLGLLLTTACTTQTTINDISFRDSQGIKYESSSAGEIIKKNYNLDSLPAIIVLATSDVELPFFVSQLSNIDLFNAEKYEYLLVTANTGNVDSSGYYTSSEQAESILKGSAFKIIIINRQGNIVIESTKILSAVELKKHLIG
jgi:hypothetical protein